MDRWAWLAALGWLYWAGGVSKYMTIRKSFSKALSDELAKVFQFWQWWRGWLTGCWAGWLAGWAGWLGWRRYKNLTIRPNASYVASVTQIAMVKTRKMTFFSFGSGRRGTADWHAGTGTADWDGTAGHGGAQRI